MMMTTKLPRWKTNKIPKKTNGDGFFYQRGTRYDTIRYVAIQNVIVWVFLSFVLFLFGDYGTEWCLVLVFRKDDTPWYCSIIIYPQKSGLSQWLLKYEVKAYLTLRIPHVLQQLTYALGTTTFFISPTHIWSKKKTNITKKPTEQTFQQKPNEKENHTGSNTSIVTTIGRNPLTLFFFWYVVWFPSPSGRLCIDYDY